MKTHTICQRLTSVISVSLWGLQQSWPGHPLWPLASFHSHCQPEACTQTSNKDFLVNNVFALTKQMFDNTNNQAYDYSRTYTSSIHITCLIFTSLKSFLACFPKMKVGLSNHQSVCLYVPPLITSKPLCRSSVLNFTKIYKLVQILLVRDIQTAWWS
jgi:hypothetical protein